MRSLSENAAATPLQIWKITETTLVAE